MIVPATDVMFIIGGLLLLGYKHLSRPCADHAEPRPAQGPQSRHTAQYRMAGIAHFILRPFVEARNGGVGPISCRAWWIRLPGVIILARHPPKGCTLDGAKPSWPD
jgi:hypothetical protein